MFSKFKSGASFMPHRVLEPGDLKSAKTGNVSAALILFPNATGRNKMNNWIK